MKENDQIYIRPVDNGFIVEPTIRRGEKAIESEIKVFRSMSELNSFISDHYPHRSKCIESDT